MENLKNKLSDFHQISLEQLNTSSSFMNRIDTKYLLTESKLELFLEKLKKDFSILEIKGIKVFSYESTYMDSDDYFFYNQHINKKENKTRTKLRTRIYLDSDIAFSEYKQKEFGITKKFRYQIPLTEANIMSEGQKDFFAGLWKSFYNNNPIPELSPKLKTTYNRVTFVSNKTEERLTIDFNINLKNIINNKEKKLENLVIIESKTTKKDTLSSNFLNELNIKKAKSCSKYGLGIYYTGTIDNPSVFKNTVKKINKIAKK